MDEAMTPSIRSDMGSSPPPRSGPSRSRSIYVSHFISTWNSRGFEFGAVLFLAKIYPGTLLQMSIYALARALAAIICSPAIGRYIDQKNRLVVVRNSIIGQRLAVTVSCAIFLIFRNFPTLQVPFFMILILLACVEKLCIIMNTIAVERDWVVVVSDGNEILLQQMNSQMRRIDLFCKLISPLAIALLSGYSTTIAVAVTLVTNSTSVIGEYFLIVWVYNSSPALAEQTSSSPMQSRKVWSHIKAYSKSQAFLPSLSLSLLYLTVLSFSGQMITYLFAIEYPHLTSVDIGIMRTVSTILEISSTFIAPHIIKHIGVVRTGIWSLSWQSICLTPVIMMFWTGPFSIYVLIIGVVLSRVGLWSFDLTAQLLVQNSVDADQRGSFSATESSIQNFFELCTFGMTIIWSKPNHFKYPATISVAAVYLAAACYARFVRVERGHLLHIPACCGPQYKSVVTDEPEELSTRHVSYSI